MFINQLSDLPGKSASHLGELPVHKINDVARQQNVMGQLNRQTAERTAKRTANASVFLFFPTAHFFKTILASRTNGTFSFAPTHKAAPSQNQKSHFLPMHHITQNF